MISRHDSTSFSSHLGDAGRVRLAARTITATMAAVLSLIPARCIEAQEAGPPLAFRRVHVPVERLEEIPLGGLRYVPMTMAEFQRGLTDTFGEESRQEGLPSREVVAESAEYALRWTGRGPLVGQAAVEVSIPPQRVRVSLPLGDAMVRTATVETAEGTGAASVCGLEDGSLVVLADEPGRYAWDFRLELIDAAAGRGRFRLPMVPAVYSVVELTVPRGIVPVVADARAAGGPQANGAGLVTWRFELTPRASFDCLLTEGPATPPGLAVWTHAAISRRELALTATVRPSNGWREQGLLLDVDPGLRPQRVAMEIDGTWRPLQWLWQNDSTLSLGLPPECIGTRRRIVVEAIAAFDTGVATVVPLVRPSRSRWAGGGLAVELDDYLVVQDAAWTAAVPVADSVAAGWPEIAPGGEKSLLLEHQEPDAMLTLTVAPRQPRLDVTRVTTVDISPSAVLARAACEVSIDEGEVFELEAQVAAGWLIDAVEMPSRSERPEWRIEPIPGGSLLRVDLATAITPGRLVRLEIRGHRVPLRPNSRFPLASIDMLRLQGESRRSGLVEIRTTAETTIETLDDRLVAILPEEIPQRFGTLATSSGIRLRLPAGVAPNGELVLLRKRPPVDVRTSIRLTARDDRLTESFTFECTPIDADLDSVVVHFSVPTQDSLEWSLVPPAGGAVFPRRLEPAERRASGDQGDAWILDFVPPIRETVTVRGVQAVPLNGPRAAPLAWVEAAINPVGELQLRNAGRRRPQVRNRSLAEIPGTAAGDRAASAISFFIFDPVADLGPAGPPMVVLPGRESSAVARAWAWNATTTCWCHSSGAIEFESVFEIENHGRPQIVLSHPADKRIQEVLVDGVQLSASGRDTLGGEIRIELPAGRRMVRLEVRAVADASASGVWPWWGIRGIDLQAGSIDVPVMERVWQIGVPPALQIASVSPVLAPLDARPLGWTQRLLGAELRPRTQTRPQLTSPPPPSGDSRTLVRGFEMARFTAASGRIAGTSVWLVPTRLVHGLAVAATVSAALAAFFIAGSRPLVAVVACGLVAVASLWVPPPWIAACRGAWLGMLAATWYRRSLRGAAVTACLLASCSLPPVAAAADPLPVFVTGEDPASTVLVPDGVFRVLASGRASREQAGARMLGALVTAELVDAELVDASAAASPRRCVWQMRVEVVCDSRTSLVLRQETWGGSYRGDSLRVDGVAVGGMVEAGGRILRVPLAAAGRHVVEFDIEPALSRRGELVVAEIGIPVTPATAVAIDGNDNAASVICEASRGTEGLRPTDFVSGQGSAGRFDLSGRSRLRLAWPSDREITLVSSPAVAATRNEIVWGEEECRITARFDVDPDGGIFQAIEVVGDPDLFPVNNESDLEVKPLAAGLWRVERRRPVRGRAELVIPFRMRFDDPVGVFPLPTVQPAMREGEAAAGSAASVFELRAAAGLEASVLLPPSAVAESAGEPDTAGETVVWRLDSLSDGQQAVVTVRRRAMPIRGTQQNRIVFEPDRIRTRLDGVVDASDTPLVMLDIRMPVGFTVEQARLERILGQAGDAESEAGTEAVPFQLTPIRPGVVRVLCQRPRIGGYRLRVDARGEGEVGREGALPLLAVEQFGETAAIVECRREGGGSVELFDESGLLSGRDAAPGAPRWRPIDVVADAPPRYRLVDETENEPDEELLPQGAEPSADGEDLLGEQPGDRGTPRVELADIRFASDSRGRGWGVARIALVPRERQVRIRLPEGMRLFELFVDGHPLVGRPIDETVWELELLDTSRPRTLLAIFAGDLGDTLASGMPVEISPPELVDVQTRQVVWTLRGPANVQLGVMPPARPATAEEVAEIRRQAGMTLEAELDAALAGRDFAERSRVQREVSRFLAHGESTAAEQAWVRTDAAVSADAYAVSEGGQPIVVRGLATKDATIQPRAVATAMIILVVGVAWSLSNRWRNSWGGAAGRIWPAVAGAVAVVWLVLLQPVWPAVAMLIAAAIAAAVWFVARRAALRRGGGNEVSLVVRDPSSTQVVSLDPDQLAKLSATRQTGR